MGFFENLNFSSANEDGESELAALAGAARIVCLTGSGTRPLDMLLSDAEEIIALDVNPTQNALLALKMAAMERLDRDAFLAFVGIAESHSRTGIYQHIRQYLSPAVQDHWDRHLRKIEGGVWHAGKWEKLLLWNARCLKLFRGRHINALLAAPDVQAQTKIWQDKFAHSALRTAIEMIGRDWIWRWVMREPAGEFLPKPQEVGKRLDDDFEATARTFLFRDSDFAMLVFRGRHDAQGALPVHLQPQNYDLVKSRLGRLHIVEGGISDLPRLELGEIDGFSLSDFGSYCGPEFYADCWKGILAVAAADAKFCERIFMNDMAVPFETVDVDEALSQKLSVSDKAIIYRVRAGVIRRAAHG
ncbi:DUF3419 family protein [Allorhizobium taibaishanense]|uniref:S-adenosylmethionine-diacylglycerol 3-amino-3-carboxypropyl transferase n=1 Tax=Allorhizobium taibaishanense TaxID=887144 RepID=A0A1Q9A996_9HYPH|nr:DUF3419 family protein [Allorhizobium taibaishanense]MBB4009807.1 S-adenosylmethionine-diacylglycerol 3-amino-3-carboxypropyl transferase [Allorhizobium taibaishanense]OLP51451.1 hypothetical protein BJF91_15455 [Allorhizobium taibaishanense]